MSNSESNLLEDSSVNSLKKLALNHVSDINTFNKEGKMSLHIAVEMGSIEDVKELLANGADINAVTQEGKTPLYIAAENGNVSIVKLLLEMPSLTTGTLYHGKSPLFVAIEKGYRDIIDTLLADDRCAQYVDIIHKGSKPLHVAAKFGDKEMVDSLLGKDGDVNAIDSDGCSPLWLSLMTAREEIVDALLNDNRVDVNLEHQNSSPLLFSIQEKNVVISIGLITRGADITFADKNGLTPLHHAVDKGLIDVVDCLIKKGAGIHVETNRGNTALHIAAMDGELEIAKLLIDNGAHVDRRSGGYYELTPLQLAVKNDKLDLAKYLIDKGADINAMDPDSHYALRKGGTLLHWVARHYHPDFQDKVIRFLVENGADVNATSNDGRTPLCLLVKHYGNLDTMRYLIEKGASLNKGGGGGTPLYWAFYVDYGGGYPEIANFLIEMGCDVNGVIDYFGNDCDRMRSALHLAKNLSTVKLLIAKGANVNATDKDGNTPLHFVRTISVAKYLVKNGANINTPNNEGFTPLHVAENFHIAKFLIEQGADVKATTNKGYTPLHLALNGHIAELLIEKGADVTAVTSDGKSVLHTAAESEVFHNSRYEEIPDLIHLYVQKGLDVNITDSRGNTPLHCCGKEVNIEVAARLLENGANMKAVNNDNVTPVACDQFYSSGSGVFGRMLESVEELFTAVKTSLNNSDLSKIRRMILETRVVNYVPDESRLSLLHYAVQQNRKDVVELLLIEKRSLRDKKIISSKNRSQKKSLSGYNDGLTRILGKIKVNAFTKDKWTPLHYAARGNNLDIVKLLLESGAAFDIETNEGQTPKELTESNDIKDLLLLVKKQFDCVKEGNYEEMVKCAEKDLVIINAVQKDGCSPLHWAIRENHENIVTYLLDNAATSTGVTNDGETVLHFAATSETVFGYLLEHLRCIDRLDELINAKTSDGNTALHIACKNGCLEIVKSLMKCGAWYNVKNKEGSSPIDLSTNEKVTDLLKMTDELFDDAEKEKCDILNKLQCMASDLLTAVMNVRNHERNTLQEIVKMNDHAFVIEGMSMLSAEKPKNGQLHELKSTHDDSDDEDYGFGLFD